MGRKEDRANDRTRTTRFNCGKRGYISFGIGAVRPNVESEGKSGQFKKASDNKLKPRTQDKPIGRLCHEKENPGSALAVMEKNEDVYKVLSSGETTMNVNINGIVLEVLINSDSVRNLMGITTFRNPLSTKCWTNFMVRSSFLGWTYNMIFAR